MNILEENKCIKTTLVDRSIHNTKKNTSNIAELVKIVRLLKYTAVMEHILWTFYNNFSQYTTRS